MSYISLKPNLLIASLISLCFLLTFSSGCKRKKGGGTTVSNAFSLEATIFSDEEFASALKTVLKPVDTTADVKKQHILTIDQAINLAYSKTEYKPIWVAEDGDAKDAELLIKDLEKLTTDGLNPAIYNTLKIKQQIQNVTKGKPEIAAVIAFDTMCTRAYLQASKDLLLGVLNPSSADSLWYHANDASWNAAMVIGNAYTKGYNYYSLDSFRSKLPAYSLLQKELATLSKLNNNKPLIAAKQALGNIKLPDTNTTYIIKNELPDLSPENIDASSHDVNLLKAYQDFYGRNPDGKLDTGTLKLLKRMPDDIINVVNVNLERLRWLPQQWDSLYVLVNIPQMRLVLHRNGEDVMNMRVVVGKPIRQTPALNAMMANVVINPPWGVPPTILKKDVLPGILRSGDRYLASKGLSAFKNGREVSASEINASNYRSFTFRQPPGDDNALGVVKFNFPNPWNIYLHDTPHRGDFPLRYRARSSGCVRVQHPKELALYIFDMEGIPIDASEMDSIITTHNTRFEQLKTKIPVHLVYLTANVDSAGKEIVFLQDVYKRDGKLLKLLKAKTNG